MEVANEVSHTSSNEVISASGTSVNGEVSTSFSTPGAWPLVCVLGHGAFFPGHSDQNSVSQTRDSVLTFPFTHSTHATIKTCSELFVSRWSWHALETQRGQRQERRKDDDGKRDESRTSMGGTYTPKARRRDAAEELVDSKDSSNNEEKEVSGTTAGFKSGARSSALHVVLMGDSVLDDFHWLSDKKQDVRQQVGDRLLKVWDPVSRSLRIHTYPTCSLEATTSVLTMQSINQK